MMNHMNPSMQMPNNNENPSRMGENIVNANPMSDINIYKPRGNGTLISDLIKNDESIDNRSRQGGSHYSKHNIEREYKRVGDIANAVNNSLKTLEKFGNNYKKNVNSKPDTEEYDNSEDKNEDIHDKIILETVDYDHTYLKLIIEFVLIITLYVILSQHFVISFVSKYIPQINPIDDGTIGMVGIIIYGLIFTVLFVVIRKLIFMKL